MHTGLSFGTNVDCTNTPEADVELPLGVGDYNPLFCHNFPKNMTLKKVWSVVGTHPRFSLCTSATDSIHWNAYTYVFKVTENGKMFSAEDEVITSCRSLEQMNDPMIPEFKHPWYTDIIDPIIASVSVNRIVD